MSRKKKDRNSLPKLVSLHHLADDVKTFFRDQLRAARGRALGDAEAYDGIVQVIERLGKVLTSDAEGMYQLAGPIATLASLSPLAFDVPDAHQDFHTRFDRLYELVREARNDAVHDGAQARHLTTRAIELALILEDALMPPQAVVGDYMVRGPVTAELWQPLSFLRQTMLTHSFSYLPVQLSSGGWKLVSDHALAAYLGAEKQQRKDRLKQSLEVADSKGLTLVDAVLVEPDQDVDSVLSQIQSAPVLVARDGGQKLLGIVSAFDLL